MPDETSRWFSELHDLEREPQSVVGAGMEGTVFDLADGSIVKVWHRRARQELEILKIFYDAVGATGLPCAVPMIVDVLPLADRWATAEVRLEGQPLWQAPGISPPLDARHVEAIIAVLAALADVRPTPEMAILPVLEGEAAFDANVPFAASLAGLVERRAVRYEESLVARLADLDALVSAVIGHLGRLSRVPPALVHGDLVPQNILTANGRPTAVLDFGFLSTIGDPAFDAAITASISDMYGPAAARSEALLDEAVSSQRTASAHRATTGTSCGACASWNVRLCARR